MIEGRAAPRFARILAGVVTLLAAVLLMGLIYQVQRSGQQRDHALVRIQHSFAVALTISRVQGAIARAEAALGRYVLDGDRRTGTIYYDEWMQAGDRLDDLARLTMDNPAQRPRIARLRALYDRRGRELAGAASSATYKQGMPALSLYYAAGRSPTLPALTRALQDIVDAENELLGRRAINAADRVDQSNDLTRQLSAVGILLALSVIALGWLMATVMASRRAARDTADMEADRAAWLDAAVRTRTAELSDANARLRAEAATREEAEARLRQLQKMEAVGQLTGGIAHDFNNMLAVVLGGLEMARRRLGDGDVEATRHLDSAIEGAERAAVLTRRLLTFARAEPLTPTTVAPDRLLHGMSDLIDRTIGERIAVTIAAASDIWPVWIDAYQLENALLNLAVNARDAMDGSGALVMRADNARLGAGEVGVLSPGDYVRLSVRDSGAGMTPEVLERVFEPFFTTKPVGQGTGLGLSQIFGFARQSGGDVAIASVVGAGTTVSIYLPRHARAAAAPVQEPRTASPMAQPDLAAPIVLVEDDARVRAASAAALVELGCAVVACAGADEALLHLRGGHPAGLLMTDVVMPGMNGVELVRAVRGERPDLPVLFVTGFVGDAGDMAEFGGGVVLRKPFTLRALARAVGDATGGGS